MLTREVNPSIPPVYAVNVSTAQEVSDTIRFAVDNNIKLTIKGAAHEFLLRNSAPDALLIWTRYMTGLEFYTDKEICGTVYDKALMSEAGNSWYNVYTQAEERGWLAIGGQSPSVGVAGWTLGGGFGATVKVTQNWSF